MVHTMRDAGNCIDHPEEIAELVLKIRDEYCEGCLRFTGSLPDDALPEVDRRRDVREPLAIPFYLQPVQVLNEKQVETRGESTLAVTRDLSLSGIGIQSDVPLDQRYYMAEFDCPKQNSVRFLVEIRWSQKKSSHNYQAGCSIVCPLDHDCRRSNNSP
ncbi:PilZ domain-containing protein [Planctomicrobium sp. SH527]|uniref:PilZ domain-containing protein n=1 Tax=Planctomicrobium sp. SH527 TaxID=3448123 RepID=UPI003F5C3A22